MGCPDCGDLVIYSPIFRESYCQKCGTVPDSESKYPEITSPRSEINFVLRQEKLGCAPPKKLPAYQRLRYTKKLFGLETKEARRLRNAMVAFNLVSSHLKLHDGIRRQAAFKYKDAVLKNLLNGRDSYAMAAASVGSVCNFPSIWLDLRPVIEIFGLTREKMTTCYDALNSRKKIKEPLEIGWVSATLHGEILQVLFGFGLPSSVIAKSEDLFWMLVRQKHLRNKERETLAAYAVMRTCEKQNYKIDRTKVAKAFGVSERSIRRMRYVKLEISKGRQPQKEPSPVSNETFTRVDMGAADASWAQLVTTRNLKLSYKPKGGKACITDVALGWNPIIDYYVPPRIRKLSSKRSVRKLPVTFTYGQCFYCLKNQQLSIMNLRWCLDCGRTHAARHKNANSEA